MSSFLFSLLLPLLLAGTNPNLLKVKSVYLLPMSNGMDQYLANQLRASGIYVVVSDPKAADGIFTDSLGPAFEKKMTELYPPEVDEEAEESRESGEGRVTVNRKGRGMVFLVERGSRHVVWSTYEPSKNTLPHHLDQAAKRITQRLKKDLGLKPLVQ